MKLVERLRKLKDFRDNVLGYCSYFYILEYLVRFKGQVELQDRLEWITELLYDYFFEYGKIACYSETLQALDNYVIKLHIMPEKSASVGPYYTGYLSGCSITYNTANINNYIGEKEYRAFNTIREAYYLLVTGHFENPCPTYCATDCKTKEQLDAVFNTAHEGFCFMLQYSEPILPTKCTRLIAHLLLHPLLGLLRRTENEFFSLAMHGPKYNEFFAWLGLTEEDVKEIADFMPSTYTYTGWSLAESWSRVIRRMVYYEKAKRDLGLTDREILSCLADFFSIEIEVPELYMKLGWTGGEGGKAWQSITLTVRDIIDRRIDKVHHIDILWHLEHKRTWLNRILSFDERQWLKEVLDAKFKGDFTLLYQYAVDIDPEISGYRHVMTLTEIAKTGWIEKEKALAKDVEVALELGIAPV